jgi:hypothetical protein
MTPAGDAIPPGGGVRADADLHPGARSDARAGRGGLLHLDPHRGVIVHKPSSEELEEIYL